MYFIKAACDLVLWIGQRALAVWSCDTGDNFISRIIFRNE